MRIGYKKFEREFSYGEKKTLNNIQIKAVKAYRNQWDRCNNPNNKEFYCYGGKGIKVLYTQKQLMSWYEKEIRSFIGTRPTIGRIDHSKDYCLNNLTIESLSSNIRERNDRVGRPYSRPKKKVGIFSKNTDECIAIFDSISDCGTFFGSDSSGIAKVCKTKRPSGSQKHNWYYRFVSECGNMIM